MFLRQFLTLFSILILFVSALDAQVNVAAPGESGLGVGAAAAFTADGTAIGMQLGGTASGLVDIGLNIRRETPDGGNSYWVKGVSLDLVPFRSRNQSVRWSLGGTFSYEFASIKYESYFYDPYYGGFPASSTKSVDVLSFGGIVFADVDVSRKTYLQITGQVALADYNTSIQSITLYTIGAGFVTRQTGSGKVGFLASATVPSRGDYWTFGVQINLFWAQRRKRLE